MRAQSSFRRGQLGCAVPAASHGRYSRCKNTAYSCHDNVLGSSRPKTRQDVCGAPLTSSRQRDLAGLGCGACMPSSTIVSSTIRASSSEERMRVIGVGQRGIHIAHRVQNDFKRCQILSIDTEASKDQTWATRTELQQMTGLSLNRGPGQPQSESNFAFIIASASCVSGCKEALSSLIGCLREVGIFTAVAIAMPFGFEGSRRLQAASELATALGPTVNLMALVEQNALMKAHVGAVSMTAAEASDIADSALEHTVRCIMTAVQAPEILERTIGGALFWHGGDGEHSRRLVGQRVQHFLAQPGIAALGRGAAAMSSELQESMGACQALMQLASDAVKAAADSPFLDGAPRSASSLLCCISLPGGVCEGDDRDPQAVQQYRMDRAAAKLAVQAAAGTMRQLFACKGLLMCYCSQTALEVASLPSPAGKVQLGVGATILVLRPSLLSHAELSDEAASTLSIQTDPVATTGSRNAQVPPSQRSGPKLPASAWGALSAMAGGSAGRSPPGQPRSSQEGGTSPQQSHRSRSQRPGQSPDGSANRTRDILVVSAKAGPADPSLSSSSSQVTPSIGDQLADNLIAQSLDLPPKAAKWRKSQRAKSEQPHLMVQAPEAAWQPQEGQEEGLSATLRSLLGSPQQEFDIRERTFAILERDRGDAWEQLEENT